MGQRHFESNNKGKIKNNQVNKSYENYDYDNIKYEVMSTYLMKGIICQSIKYLSSGSINSNNYCEINQNTINISIFGMEFKDTISTFSLYE